MNQKIRCYSELKELKTFEERFEYLKLGGSVGKETFGFDRWLNQNFYKSKEWEWARDKAILRDSGCDLGILDRPIGKVYYKDKNGVLREVNRVLVHHMNPVTNTDLIEKADWVLDPEFLITTILSTHNAIHYGDVSLIQNGFSDRKPNDTIPWRRLK